MHTFTHTFGPVCVHPNTRRVCHFSNSNASHSKQAARLSPAAAPSCTAGGVAATRLCLHHRRRSPGGLIARMFFHLTVLRNKVAPEVTTSQALLSAGAPHLSIVCDSTGKPELCVFVFNDYCFNKLIIMQHVSSTLAHKLQAHGNICCCDSQYNNNIFRGSVV